MALRIERARVQDPTSREWIDREIKIVSRFRVRIVSEKTLAHAHQYGHGEEFELALDTDLDLWTRRLGSDAPFRKEDHAYGVAVMIGDNITAGLTHTIRIVRRGPGRNPDANDGADERFRWECSCGKAQHVWNSDEEETQIAGVAHVDQALEATRADLDQAGEARRARARTNEHETLIEEIARRRDRIDRGLDPDGENEEIGAYEDAVAAEIEREHASPISDGARSNREAGAQVDAQIPMFKPEDIDKPEGGMHG